tara:strand:+ start:543 stop:869 length:327 start_codon:yes stop_codon:yes gene_type:complete
MSKFSELAGLATTTHETGVVETTAPPAPPAPPEPVVEETPPTPPVYENPLDDMPVAKSPTVDIPKDLKWVSKVKLEEIGRSVGIELDRRLSQPKLVEQLEAHIASLDS